MGTTRPAVDTRCSGRAWRSSAMPACALLFRHWLGTCLGDTGEMQRLVARRELYATLGDNAAAHTLLEGGFT